MREESVFNKNKNEIKLKLLNLICQEKKKSVLNTVRIFF